MEISHFPFFQITSAGEFAFSIFFHIMGAVRTADNEESHRRMSLINHLGGEQTVFHRRRGSRGPKSGLLAQPQATFKTWKLEHCALRMTTMSHF